jgi:DNA-binding SARP family transcriptional activator/tetratricopeptide (TPR) repeat protein
MVELSFGVLGPLEVVRDGQPVAINAPKLRVVLATLLLRANTTVPVDRLGERLWGEELPSTARKTAQLFVMRLRRVLGDESGLSPLIHTRPDGYLIDVEPHQLDLLRYRRQAEEARKAQQVGDRLTELNRLNDALACWRGAALSDVPSESLHREDVMQLAEDRLRLQERRMQVSLDLGRHREIISELIQLTNDHPWHEAFWVQLIMALHRSDRLADALDTYRTVHRLFANELGIEPGPRLQRLHRTLLTDESEAQPEPETQERSEASAQPISQLPADVHRFVGRAAAIERLTGESSEPLGNVVISGPPGVGKTALAVHVAHLLRPRFPNGQLYMNLQGYAADPPLGPAAALTRFLGALGVPRERVPADIEDQAALFRSLLTGRKMLLLLDNAAHADQVRPLLPGEPGCAVLITSRADLRGLAVSPGAEQLPLGVLTEGESRAVLTDLIDSDRADAERVAVGELAKACAHLPLALRIAGANLAADPLRDIADYTEELRDTGRLTELAIADDERFAVRVAFDQSYLRLREDDRRLFRLLGLSPGPDFGVVAAAALGSMPPMAVGHMLDRLTAASLLHRPAPGRYQFHDLIKEYAADRANTEESPADTTAALTRMLDFYVTTAAAATRSLSYASTTWKPPLRPGATPARWLDDELHNLMSIVVWAATHAEWRHYAWELVDAMRGYLQASGPLDEVLAGCSAALRVATETGNHQAQLSMLDILGSISHNLYDFQRATGYHTRALGTAREVGDLDSEANALLQLGRTHTRLGQPRQAERCLRQALAVSRKAGNAKAEALALNRIGVVRTYMGDPRSALEWHERSLRLAQNTGNREATAIAFNGRAIAHWALGQLDEAIADQEEALAYCREGGQPLSEVIGLNCLAEANCDAERFDIALTYANEALARSIQLGEQRGEATARELIATVHTRLGEHHEAVDGYLEALRLAGQTGYSFGESSILIGLAAAHRGLGAAAKALSYCERALTQLRDNGNLLLEAAALTELAHAYLDLGQSHTAAHHIETAIAKSRYRGQRLTHKRAQLVADLIQANHANGLSSLAHPV